MSRAESPMADSMMEVDTHDTNGLRMETQKEAKWQKVV